MFVLCDSDALSENHKTNFAALGRLLKQTSEALQKKKVPSE